MVYQTDAISQYIHEIKFEIVCSALKTYNTDGSTSAAAKSCKWYKIIVQ